MNNLPTHEEISAEAKRLWEEEGQPEGKADEHWTRAEEELKRRSLRDSEGGETPETLADPVRS